MILKTLDLLISDDSYQGIDQPCGIAAQDSLVSNTKAHAEYERKMGTRSAYKYMRAYDLKLFKHFSCHSRDPTSRQ